MLDYKFKKNSTKKTEESKTSDMANLYGKLPPQNLEAEEAVLGALMVEKGSMPIIQDILWSDSFYKESHRIIYEAIEFLDTKGDPTDLLTVTNQLRKIDKLVFIGGPYYLVELTQSVSSAANLEFHARIVSENYIKRELIRVSSELTRDSFDYSCDVLELLDNTVTRLNTIYEKAINRPPVDFVNVMSENIKNLALNIGLTASQRVANTGIITYFDEELDNNFVFGNSNMIIVGGRPGMGKTSFAISLFNNNVIRGINGLFFSLEMSARELANKSLACQSHVYYNKLSQGDVNHYDIRKLEEARDTLSKLSKPLVDDNPSMTIEMIKAKATLMKRKHDIKFIIVDYIQLINPSTQGNRDQQLGHVSRQLKVLAKNLDIPVIVLAQLSRETEKRGGDKKPQMSDLRESGSIEQDADSILFPYRPWYYGIEFFEDNSSTKDRTEIIYAKNRHGGTGSVTIPSFMPTGRFGMLLEENNKQEMEPIDENNPF